MLHISNLFKNYGDKEVLKGVNLNLQKGDLKCIVGINGSGKTTLIECICGVKKFNSGDINILGFDVKNKKNKNKIKNIIGYMPQTFTMYNDLTVKENLQYVSSIYNLPLQIIDKTIEKFNLSNHKNTLAQNLSGGYKQLLSLACSSMHKPELLILDEPTSAMDPIFRKQFWDIIHEFHNNGTTILFITHYVEEVNQCKEFICLFEGKIIYDGCVDKFKKNNLLDMDLILQYKGE